MTATEDDVLYAILSLDAYNRGYAPGMGIPDNTAVDGAQLIFDSDTSLAHALIQAESQSYLQGQANFIVGHDHRTLQIADP